MRFTADELGLAEFEKADLDRRKYRRSHEALFAAQRFGTLAIARMQDGLDARWITPYGISQADEDAVMFARLAFHGWRAYRMMVGE